MSIKKYIYTALLIFAVKAFTGTALADGDSGYFPVRSVQVVSADLTLIFMTGATQNPDSCGANTVLALTMADPLYSREMTVIMTAAAAGKSLDFWTSGCVTTPLGATAPNVQAVTIFISAS